MPTQRALIVDDSEVLRRLIEMCLKPAGFEVASAVSGADNDSREWLGHV